MSNFLDENGLEYLWTKVTGKFATLKSLAFKDAVGYNDLDSSTKATLDSVSDLSTTLDSHTSDTTIHVTAADKEKWNSGGASKPKAVLVTLYKTLWVTAARRMNVRVQGVLADDSKQLISIIPTMKSADAYRDAGIKTDITSDGRIIFMYANAPVSDINVWVVMTDVENTTPATPYLTFASRKAFSISVNTPGWNGTMEYSTDAANWTTWDGSAISAVDDGFSKKLLYFRGTGNTIVGGTSVENAWNINGNNVACIGNIEYLLDYQTVIAGQHPSMTIRSFQYMFYNNSALVRAPELPSVDYAPSYCCYRMFCGCTSLTTPPALPATDLATSCYREMFYNCTSLTSAPALPATTLSNYCYAGMFKNCTGLTSAPQLPATVIASQCYREMFSGCTSLTTPPALPATTLASSCYHGMFSGCTSLTTPPALPATDLATSCYREMFYGCTSLTSAPALPATTLQTNCYFEMFYGCTSLTSAPALPATTLQTNCYYEMFRDCASLISIPALPATTLTANCYYGMFSGCTSLTSIPALDATTLADRCCYRMFAGCTGLTTMGGVGVIGSTVLAPHCYYQMFQGCSNLQKAYVIGTSIFPDYCCYQMFDGCTSLTTAPDFVASTVGMQSFFGMFSNCTSLVTAPKVTLSATTLADSCYYGMFSGCTSLTTPPALPATTLASSCYANMFYECPSLTALPALPATTLPTNCYAAMFRGCKKIKLSGTQTDTYTIAYCIPTSGGGTLEYGASDAMFYDTGGTFKSTPAINVTYYLDASNSVVPAS